MAEQCKKNPKRFSGFASLSMHDPKQAAQELTRAVKELGLKGAMYGSHSEISPEISILCFLFMLSPRSILRVSSPPIY
jgi:predicted TIM-barrel fold metal-dependent hydrolase